jgi:hemerythrin-like metal-binding protein
MNLNIQPIMLDPADFTIGYDVIDKQHAEIIECINELYVLRFKGDTQIRHIVKKLKHHVESHFRFEEVLMDRCVNYTFRAEHLRDHREMAQTSFDLLKRYNRGEDVSEELQGFLFHLLSHHINKIDRSLVECCYKEKII